MTQDYGQIVQHFLNRWAIGIDETKAAFRESFAPGGVWNNVGLLITTGAEESIAALDNFVVQMGFVRMGHDMVNFCVDGRRVYTERVDRFFDADDREFLALRYSACSNWMRMARSCSGAIISIPRVWAERPTAKGPVTSWGRPVLLT